MKTNLILLMLFLAAVSMQAQAPKTNIYCWPIKDAKAGTNMISTPQSHIEKELNFSNLFISAPEGTTVLCPADGTVHYTGVGYILTLIESISFGENGDNSFDEKLTKLKPQIDQTKYNLKYLTGLIGINCGNGIVVYIAGLSGSEVLKKGQAIKKGTPIGKVAYSYHKIKKPSIQVSIAKNGKTSDPMTPFGIKSTYIDPSKAKTTKPLTPKQTK